MGPSLSASTKSAPVSAVINKNGLAMKTATFALGCFWHSDALYGCQKGVFRTRVGYTGGTLNNPTYRNLGDHTEAVDVDYDPEKTSYKNLLDLFWKNHDPTELHKRQYRSAIFCRNEEEKSLAESMKKELEGKIGRKVVTDIEPSGKFFNAEDYHQKYFLQTHHSKLFKSLGIKQHELVDSEVAAKLNGYVVGLNSMECFNTECESLGLSPENIAYVKQQISKGKQSHC